MQCDELILGFCRYRHLPIPMAEQGGAATADCCSSFNSANICALISMLSGIVQNHPITPNATAPAITMGDQRDTPSFEFATQARNFFAQLCALSIGSRWVAIPLYHIGTFFNQRRQLFKQIALTRSPGVCAVASNVPKRVLQYPTNPVLGITVALNPLY